MSKIAITGTIASGKSTCSNYLRSLGFFVLDLDEVNRKILEEDEDIKKEIKESFPDVFDPRLNKKKLAAVIFNDKKSKEKLENILYPRIKEIMFQSMRKYNPFFCEVPLLFESGFDIYFDEFWLVVADENDCIERLIKKGYTRKQAIERIDNQMPVEEKKKRATKILYNKDTFDSFIKEIQKTLENSHAWK